MKTQIENPIKNYLLAFLTLLTVLALVSGCAGFMHHPDPLAGWKMDFAPQLDPAIAKDCQDYIQKLSPEEKKSARVSGYFENGAGQHAVKIEIGLNGTWWQHILIYDTGNKRIKAIKYASGNYGS